MDKLQERYNQRLQRRKKQARRSKKNFGSVVPLKKHKLNKFFHRRQPVLQIDKNTNEIIAKYGSIADAGKAFGKSYQNIVNALRNEQCTAYGYKWQYTIDESL